MYKRNRRLQLNDCGTFFKPSSHLLCRKQRGIMTDLHVLYVKITPPPLTASVGWVPISGALSPLTAWPLSLAQKPVFFSPNASPQSAAFKCWIVLSCHCIPNNQPTAPPPPTSPGSVMTPFHSILSLKTDKAPPVPLFPPYYLRNVVENMRSCSSFHSSPACSVWELQIAAPWDFCFSQCVKRKER